MAPFTSHVTMETATTDLPSHPSPPCYNQNGISDIRGGPRCFFGASYLMADVHPGD